MCVPYITSCLNRYTVRASEGIFFYYIHRCSTGNLTNAIHFVLFNVVTFFICFTIKNNKNLMSNWIWNWSSYTCQIHIPVQSFRNRKYNIPPYPVVHRSSFRVLVKSITFVKSTAVHYRETRNGATAVCLKRPSEKRIKTTTRTTVRNSFSWRDVRP